MEYITGHFVREHKSRFLCDVQIDGKEVECYVPSSCKLSKFVDLTGKEVLLQPINKKESRTKYSLYAAKIGRNYVLLNLAEANRVVEEALQGRYFSFLGKRTKVRREAVIEGYKADLFIADSRTLIEVKTLLSFEKEGYFPSMYFKRAEEQLIKLHELQCKGYKIHYFIVSLNPQVKELHINKRFQEYCKLLETCKKNGMECWMLSIRIKDYEPEICRRIKLSE